MFKKIKKNQIKVKLRFLKIINILRVLLWTIQTRTIWVNGITIRITVSIDIGIGIDVSISNNLRRSINCRVSIYCLSL